MENKYLEKIASAFSITSAEPNSQFVKSAAPVGVNLARMAARGKRVARGPSYLAERAKEIGNKALNAHVAGDFDKAKLYTSQSNRLSNMSMPSIGTLMAKSAQFGALVAQAAPAVAKPSLLSRAAGLVARNKFKVGAGVIAAGALAAGGSNRPRPQPGATL